jgi:hypothetical protein
MASDHSAADDLQDARKLFTFAKSQAAYGDKELPPLAMRIAIDLCGEDYVKIAEGCGWTHEELKDLIKIKPPLSRRGD